MGAEVSLPAAIQAGAAFVAGTLVGSFLNVCIYRLPRKQSVLRPGSRCPACGTPIPLYLNVPLVSYALLRGRCRQCGASISWTYPLVEGFTGLTFLLTFWRFGPTPQALVYLLFLSALITVTFIDLEHQIIPDRITLPGIGVGVLASGLLLPTGWGNALAGLLLGGGLFYALAVASRGGMGGGDIKLIAMIGAFLGWKAVLLAIFLAALTGSVVSLYLILFRGKGRKHPIPFGPFLALGGFLALFWGDAMLSWYLGP